MNILLGPKIDDETKESIKKISEAATKKWYKKSGTLIGVIAIIVAIIIALLRH